ncbi:MAG: hypothetical protein IK025_07295 [Bacteroidales bacterium]|nr:hypothetical protein [Bacteroidales bacterium]
MTVSLFAKPMEALSEYNVFLIHGAGSRWGGLDCDLEGRKDYPEAWKFFHDEKKDDESARLDGRTKDGKSLSAATGMIKDLYPWLRNDLFEGDYPGLIYFQRPFTDPANSPRNNANEIGKRTWMGRTNCSSRRSLFEEAQEIDAGGQNALREIRHDSLDSYRKIPSRNILISHSMGGVASREYVQGNIYNDDVDKVVTLDSPHEGTGALNLLLYLRENTDWGEQFGKSIAQTVLLESFAIASFLLGFDATASALSIIAFALPLASNMLVEPSSQFGIFEILNKDDGYDYTKDDSITTYIDPNSGRTDGILVLKDKPYKENTPMFRLLYGKNGMTFTDPYQNVFHSSGWDIPVPDAISIPICNAWTYLAGDGSFDERIYNTFASMTYGFIAGITMEEQGTALIPSKSGSAHETAIFKDSRTDFKIQSYNGNIVLSSDMDDYDDDLAKEILHGVGNVGLTVGIAGGIITGLGIAAAVLEETLFWNQPALKIAKAAMLVSGGIALGAGALLDATGAAVVDLDYSHRAPVKSTFQKKWHGAENKFNLAVDGASSKTPYLMEDFLYEKPYINLGLFVADSALQAIDPNCYYEKSRTENRAECEIGLYGKRDSILVSGDTIKVDGSFQKKKYNEYQQKPIEFKTGADWDKMGVKIDRWERVSGIDSNGLVAPNEVPIRHVERYEVPPITVTGYIEKYSFVVDDLMPHRLREIYMNFNFQQELVWECDVEKDSTANDACKVYKRIAGQSWPTTPLMTVPHPVKKDGHFDFDARKYFNGSDDLSVIQKDNQNTVIVSVVNKIGLSNTQRFYYLFKATEDLLESSWPLPNVVVNKIDGFVGNASALDYQGFSIVSAKDSIFRCVTAKCDSSDSIASWHAMTSSPTAEGLRFSSSQKVDSPAEGDYLWVFNATSFNSTDNSSDSSDIYLVPFVVDTTAPKFTLTTDSYCVNPDSSVFIARVKVDGNDSLTTKNRDAADIRIMQWTLERNDGGTYNKVSDAKLPFLYDVVSKDFAVTWDGVNKNSLTDGEYRLRAAAIDYALPNLTAYGAVNNLFEKVVKQTASEMDWNTVVNNHKLNVGSGTVKFRVDKTAPTLSKFDLVAAPMDSQKVSRYASLPKLARQDNQCVYVSKDSLLNISYSVREELNGRSETSVFINWMFKHIPDSNAVDRAGDSVWLDNDQVLGSWTENTGLLLEDGEYRVLAVTRDEAKNTSAPIESNPKKLLIDRTAPQIGGLISTVPVYDTASTKPFESSIKVSESLDVAVNRTGMKCSYRIVGGGNENQWREITGSVLHSETFKFYLDKSLIGSKDGKRYLEAACIDMAGNVGVRTTLFHVGKRHPNIVSPTESVDQKMPIIPIVGIAPPDFEDDENSAVYRLRYREANSTEWKTEKIMTIAANRSKDSANISKIAQSNEGVLGYFYRDSIYDKQYYIELGVKTCDSCSWRTDSVLVTLGKLVADSVKPVVAFDVSKTSMVVGVDSVNMSLRLTGNPSGAYMLRIYAEDSMGVGVFDKSVERAWANPYYGSPYDLTAGLVYDSTNSPAAIWFYQDDSLYHLRWFGLPDTAELQVSFLSSTFGETCMAIKGNVIMNLDKGCRVESQPNNFPEITSEYMSGYPMLVPPTATDNVMILSGDSGHVVMKSEGAFRIAGSHIDTLAGHNVPVYFGSSEMAGFTLAGQNIGVDTMNVLQTGWNVHPEAFGLSFTWDGRLDSRFFPADGKVKVYAEVTGIGGENAFVDVQTKEIDLTSQDVKVVLSNSLPVYPLIVKDTTTYKLGAISIPYGILYKNAYVNIEIRDSADNPIKVLLTNAFVAAHSNGKAYSVTWNGTGKDGNPVESGTYKVVIKAFPAGVVDTTGGKMPKGDSAKALLPVITTNSMIDKTPGNRSHKDSVSLYVSEAVTDSSLGRVVNRYEPIADYFVDAELSGKYLPKNIREANLVTKFSGTQYPLGFTPERFSLGIKRQRQVLNLKVLYRLTTYVESIKWPTGDYPWDIFTDEKCAPTGYKPQVYTGDEDLYFFIGNMSNSFKITKGLSDAYRFLDHADLNAHGDGDKVYKLEMIAVAKRDWENATDRSFDEMKKVAVWNMQEIQGKTVFIPYPKDGGYKPYFAVTTKTCDADTIAVDGTAKQCEYKQDNAGNKISTPGYNPNAGLFNVELTGNSSDNFFKDYNQLRTGCGKYGHQKLEFTVKLTIPPEYWDAPFGYDNLVNRTVRFDSKNISLYGDNDGYFHMLGINHMTMNLPRAKNLFDGSQWKRVHNYGLLTPFETQHLPYFEASDFPGGGNTFLFADEDENFEQTSRFTLKFYNDPNDTVNYNSRHFVAHVFAPQAGYPKSITNDGQSSSIIVTDFFMPNSGDIDFYVSMNKSFGAVFAENADKSVFINYPAVGNKPKDQNGKKYYRLGSKIHHYYNDYSDAEWLNLFTVGGDSSSYFRNLSNFNPTPSNLYLYPRSDFDPDSLKSLHLDSAKVANGDSLVRLLSISPDSYDASTNKFSAYVVLPVPISGDVAPTYTTTLEGVSVEKYNISNDTLYITASNWNQNVRYRRSLDTTSKLPERTSAEELTISHLYRYQSGVIFRRESDNNLYYGTAAEKEWTRNPWIKDVQVVSSRLVHLDDSVHSHLDAVGNTTTPSSVNIQYKNEIDVKRPKELVEIRANLMPGTKYHLLYLKDSVYYPVVDSAIEVKTAGERRLAWFNVNRLQGNTQFLLTWGGDNEGGDYSCSHYNLVIGKQVKDTEQGTVTSLFDEVSVTFPQGTLDSSDDFTVRTVAAEDYHFEVFNNVPITGPIVEVLPPKVFGDTLPRVEIKISKAEMRDMNVTPSTLKLYKVDFTNKKFIPLDKVLYGYLGADGHAAVANGFDTAECEMWNDSKCYPGNDDQWEYILISGVTKTFSVFAAMDSRLAEIPDFGLEILPAVATTSDRDVRVIGLNNFNLYVDNDSLWNDSNDITSAKPLPYDLDASGIAHVRLPKRGMSTDTNYVFVVAKNDTSELPLAPAVARALTVPTNFDCSVPSDSVWLGLDNGFMAYGASCNQPGDGIVSLYLNDRLITEIRAEIPDTIVYDGSRKIGGSSVGKIKNGVYESTYLGMSVLGNEMQVMGPKVYTDSARPKVSSWNVVDSSDVLDRIFVVSAKLEDSESGIAKVDIRPVFGLIPLKDVLMMPDSNGNVSAKVRLSRKQLANCVGCNLAITMHVEDYGHNYEEMTYKSSKLYPYPQSLALWYPAREGMGEIVREMIGTAHDLNLSMFMPWLNDVGLYFYRDGDKAVANSNVNLGTSDSYTLEARINLGYPQEQDWLRVMGFSGASRNMEIQIRGKDMRLVEQNHIWLAENVLPQEKAWSHVVVTVDSSNVNFYVNGNIAATKPAGISMNRVFNGKFSVGESSTMDGFVGHIADIRMYLSALSAEQVLELSKPVTDEGEESQLIIVNVNDMDVVNGFDRQFTCSVVGNNYYHSTAKDAKLNMTINVEQAGKYNLVLYARSASLENAEVQFGAGSKQKGVMPLAPVWRAYTVSNMDLELTSGLQNFQLIVPAGVDIAGLALATDDIPASDIAWNVVGDNGMQTVQSSKVKTFVRYEGFADSSMLRPRVRIVNTSGETINGYSVRYYFRGEVPALVHASAFFPQDSSTLSVHAESNRTGYVEWSFADSVIQANGSPFFGQGPHFGLNNIEWNGWYSADDPSFVPNAASDFVENKGIIVLDKDNNLIGGSCAEMEDEVEEVTSARVLARDVRARATTSDPQASEIYLKVENTGNMPIAGYDVRYYFFVEAGFTPVMEIYGDGLPQGVTAERSNLGNGRWMVNLHCENILGPGMSWNREGAFTLHLHDWQMGWNAEDDPGHVGMTSSVAEAVGFNVVDSLGNVIYGKEPNWPTEQLVLVETPNGSENPDSSYVVDFGYTAPDVSIPITRTEDGLVVTMNAYTYVSLDLVNAGGIPVRHVYTGTLASGQQLIRVDWSGINMRNTYLALRINGTLKSTKLLALL